MGDISWNNLVVLFILVGKVGIDGLNGIDGKEVIFRVGEGYI